MSAYELCSKCSIIKNCFFIHISPVFRNLLDQSAVHFVDAMDRLITDALKKFVRLHTIYKNHTKFCKKTYTCLDKKLTKRYNATRGALRSDLLKFSFSFINFLRTFRNNHYSKPIISTSSTHTRLFSGCYAIDKFPKSSQNLAFGRPLVAQALPGQYKERVSC